MKPYRPTQMPTLLKEIPMPEPPKLVSGYECIFCNHAANVLHRGTAYCRACYDEKNPYGKLIDS